MEILVHLRILNPAQPYSNGEFSSKKPALALKWAARGRRGMREESQSQQRRDCGLLHREQRGLQGQWWGGTTAQGFLPVSAESRKGMKGGVGGSK